MVAVVDDLIILGIIAAASVAASQVSASQSEDYANDEVSRRKAFDEKQARMQYFRNRAAQYGGDTSFMDAHMDKMARDAGYEGSMRAAEKQADMMRTQGWIGAGAQLAGGIANSAMRPNQNAGLDAIRGQAREYAQRGAQYDLNAGNSQLLSDAGQYQGPAQEFRPTDPNDGFQLQPTDYQLLQGGGIYSQGPYGDDDYATQVGLTSPRSRFRFGL